MTSEIKQRIEQIRRGEVPEGYVKTALELAPANWKRYTFGDIYTERKEPGDENLPLLMVSIHSGVSDGEVDAAELPKQVKRIEDKSQYKKAVSGDLVFNMMRAWQGAIGTVRTTGMVSPAYIVAEPNDKAYPLFMDYYSRTPSVKVSTRPAQRKRAHKNVPANRPFCKVKAYSLRAKQQIIPAFQGSV